MKYNYNKFKGRIREIYNTDCAFAEALGISSGSLCNKLNNKAFFTQKEIEKSVELLKIQPNEIPSYFFNHSVQ